MEILKFGEDNIENSLAKMSDDQLDNVAFGAIELDNKGNVLKYNAAEGDITGRSPKDVIDRQTLFHPGRALHRQSGIQGPL